MQTHPTVSDKNGALIVPGAALAAHCPALAHLDLSAQFQLDVPSIEGARTVSCLLTKVVRGSLLMLCSAAHTNLNPCAGLSACRRLRRLELPWPAPRSDEARRLAEALPGLDIC